MLNKILIFVFLGLIISPSFLITNAYANPFFTNGQFTKNGIEWCEENRALYEVLEEKFFEHHNHSLESRVCVSLYGDFFWTYEGPDRIEKLIEKSRHYSQLEIMESYEESETGIIDTTPAENKDQTLLKGTTEDGSLIVQIISSAPKINQSMEINLSFHDNTNRLASHVNFGIIVVQEEQVIIENNHIYSANGLSSLVSPPLNSDKPVDITISINGIGAPENMEQWTGPKGEVLIFTVVPEFGTVAIMLFGISILTVIIISTKNKVQIFQKV